ncbi:MAG TPA: TraB/GumN family protein [Puia sp.]|nr:TraB/GumN family protein [Puia sp.]
MKRSFLAACSIPLILLAFSRHAGTAGSNSCQHAVPDPLTNTLLWKISGNHLKQPSYLFGTMHVLCTRDAILSDSLKNVIRNCNEIYFEIDLDDMNGMFQSMKYMRMNDSKKLSDLLTPGDYNKVKSYFEKQGSILPFSMLERFKPLLISSLVEESGLDCQTTNGMELVIQQEAHAQSKKINGLETVEFQAGLFDSIPYDRQAQDLVNYIDSVDTYKKTTSELVSVYLKQDLEKIDELTRSGDASIANYIDLLLYNRSRKWADALTDLLPQKSLLIAVGAGHLPGDNGLINLLKKRGFVLTPVKN